MGSGQSHFAQRNPKKSRPRYTRPRAALLTSDATPQNMLYSCARRPPKGKEVGKQGGLEGGGSPGCAPFLSIWVGTFPLPTVPTVICQIYSSPAPARAFSALSCSVKKNLAPLASSSWSSSSSASASSIDTNRSARERSVGVERSRPRPHAM
jgi:hypothetical protein